MSKKLAEKYKIEVLYEDNHLIVVNKKSRDIVQSDKTEDPALGEKIKAYIKEKYNKPGDVFLGVVHRLDRPVSGAVIFARTSKALARLNTMLQNREINKFYWAITEQRLEIEEGHLVNYLRKNEKQNKTYVTAKNAKGSKRAELKYRLVGASSNYNLLEIELLTGRHHQIRAQLSELGCPIKGDMKYGYSRSNKNGSISLHARRLEFIHPVKKEPIKIIAPVPREDALWNFFQDTEA